MEIQENEYVRLARNQGINKIIEIEEDGSLILDMNIADEWGEETCRIECHEIDEEILNHSFKPINLIEIGDYVNGYKVLNIYEVLAPDDERMLDIGDAIPITEDRIKSIVTKEQFESVKYEV